MAYIWPILSSFILAIGPSMVARVLISLGIGVVSYASVTTLASNLATQMTTNIGSIPGAIYQLLALSGGITAINIIISALIAKAAMMALKQMRPL